MLGTDKSRSYCLEMICADFLAGAHLDNGNPEILLNLMCTTENSAAIRDPTQRSSTDFSVHTFAVPE